MKRISLVLMVGLVLCLSVTEISSQQPLELDEDMSTVENATTGEKWSYRGFISQYLSNTDVLNAGNELVFVFVFRRVQEGGIPPNYYLHLYTDLSKPCWVYEAGDRIDKHCDNTWGVWRSVADHGLRSFKITLKAYVPPPVNEEIYEPGFREEFELSGITRKDVRITINLFDGEELIQAFTDDLAFKSTTQELETMLDKTEGFLQQSKDIDSILNSGFEDADISLDTLRDHISDLGNEGGRPGWAHTLAEDMKDFYDANKNITPRTLTPPPDDKSPWGLVSLFALIFAVIGLTLGYMLKRPYIPYKELDDATQMVEDIKNKINVLGYSIEEPELQTRLSDLSSKDLSYLKNKISMIEYLITKKEPEIESGPGEGAFDEL